MVIDQIGNLISTYPIPGLILVSALLTLASTLLMKHFTDQEHIKNLKKRQKELQKEIKQCHKEGKHDRLAEINSEMVDLSMKLMKASFSIKQLIITMVPFIIIFQWIRGIYIPLYGGWWILYYLLASIFASSIYRKIFNMA